jgi:mono/diheme cytochrome c family protein
MKKLVRIVLIGAGVAGLTLLGFLAVSSQRLNKVYDIQPASLPLPGDPQAIALGRMLGQVLCAECHGGNLAGRTYVTAQVGRISTGNLTPGGVGRTYSDEDWVRAIRFGVGPDGKGLILMPSDQLDSQLNDDEMGALIAYLKTLPPVENDLPATSISLEARVNYALGRFDLITTEHMDLATDSARGFAPLHGIPLEISSTIFTCTGCHGEGLGGNGDESLNITADPERGIGAWTAEQFARFLQKDIRPDGSAAGLENSHALMLGDFSDEQLSTMWAFLQTVSPGGPSKVQP